MTNFILDDGVIVDVGQRWAIKLYGKVFTCTIDGLDTNTERMNLTFSVNIRASLCDHIGMGSISEWDLMWPTFQEGYSNGTIYPHELLEPSKSISPHSFT